VFKTKPIIILAIACSIYVAFGMYNAGIGPVFSELAAQTNSTLAEVGGILTFLFLGSLIAQLCAGPLTDRFGQRWILIISLLILAIGVISFTNAKSLPLMLAMVFVTGLGQGGVDLGANLIVTAAYTKNNTSVLNLLHFFFGLGAFFGPAVVSLAINATGSGLIVHWIAAGIFFLLMLVVLSLKSQKVINTSESAQQSSKSEASVKVYLSPLLWVLSVLILVYVGVEYGLGSWITNYMDASTGMLLQKGALVTSAYWGSLTLGRLAGAVASRKLGKFQLLVIATLGSMIGVIGLIASLGTTIPTIISIVWIGFSYGTVYPTTVAVMVETFPKNQGKTVGLLAAMASVGGLTLPWVAGVLLETGSPQAYALFMAGLISLMLIILLVFARLRKKAITVENQ
jgi:fucose permease